MRIGRFRSSGKVFYGDVRNDVVRELRVNERTLLSSDDHEEANDAANTTVLQDSSQIDNDFDSSGGILIDSGIDHSLNELETLPCLKTGKVIGVGLNYKAHAAELKMVAHKTPILFMKPPSAIIGDKDAIKISDQEGRVDFEGELGIVIGKRAYKIQNADARDHILGYTCVNDVTNRDIQKTDGQWIRAKGFNTFLPVGPYIVTGIDPTDLEIKLFQNSELKQDSHTTDMINNVYELVHFISHVMPLDPFDLIITGTPPGIASMQVGDNIEVEIENIGILRNHVE